MISSKSTIITGGRANFAIFLICLIAGIEVTLASRSCKRTVMKILEKQCGDGGNTEVRLRRATDDGEKKDVWQSLVGGLFPTNANGINKVLADNLESFLGKLLIILRESIASIILGQSNAIPTSNRYRQRRAEPTHEINAPLSITSGGPKYKLNNDEVEELYSEIFKRPDRRSFATPEKAKALLRKIAAKCCQNEDKCLREKIIACP